jgi:hypothetical protein
VKLCGAGQTPGGTPPCSETTLEVFGEGTYTVNPLTGEVTFNPLPTFTGPTTPISYQVSDSLDRTVGSTIALTVGDPPPAVASPDVSSDSFDKVQTISPLGNDSAGNASFPIDPTSLKLCGPDDAGTSGIAGSFSFYFSHHITTMEGGGISTDSDEFADDLRSMRSHGWSRDRSDVSSWTAEKSSNDSKFLFVSTGYNVRPMEIQAAIGSAQIDSIDSFIEKRRNIATRVSAALKNSQLLVIGQETLTGDHKANSWMLIPLLVVGENAQARKKLILEKLSEYEIETRPILTGNFLAQPAIQRITRHAVDPLHFVQATKITNEAFMVGAHHDLSDEQIDFLCSKLSKVAEI